MGLPIVPGGFRVQLLWSGNTATRPWSTKFDYYQPGEQVIGPTAVQQVVDAFASQFDTAWGLAGAPLASGFFVQTDLLGIRAYALSDPLMGAEAGTVPEISGTGANSIPGEVAMVSTLRTQFLGRRYRGRQYWGGLATTAISQGGLLLGTVTEALDNLVTTMMTLDVGGNSLDLCVISTVDGTGDRPAGEAAQVTSVSVDRQPDTQRRRGPRG